MTDRLSIEVDAGALGEVLNALVGPPHLIRELQVISKLRGDECPIRRLVNDYNEAVRRIKDTVVNEG